MGETIFNDFHLNRTPNDFHHKLTTTKKELCANTGTYHSLVGKLICSVHIVLDISYVISIFI